MQDNALLPLVARIYDAALDPSLWPGLLDDVARAVPGRGRLLRRVLMLHLQRAFQVRCRISDLTVHQDGLIAILDRATMPIIVVDQDARLVTANAPASALLAAGGLLAVRDGVLRVGSPTRAAPLVKALRHAARTAQAETGEGADVVWLSSRAEGGPLCVIVMPVRALDDAVCPGRQLVTLFVHQPGRMPRLDRVALSRVFGLTNSEAQVAERIAHGRTVAQIARAHGTSVHTIRKQVARILAKTGARRQSDLVRMFASPVLTRREP